MKQGGFIMTIQRAMCSSGDDKEEIEKGEKVPLNQDGSESEKDKNRDTVSKSVHVKLNINYVSFY